MAKLTALHPIEHDGKAVAEGDAFTVNDDAQIAQLVASGAATVEARKPRASKAQDDADAATKAAVEAEAQSQAEAAAAQAALETQANLLPAAE
jgi:hypothetical protein